MVNVVGVSGTTIVLGVNVVASLGLVTYLILISAIRQFFPRYTILYMYLFTSAMLTAMGALFLWVFGIRHPVYCYAFYFGKGPMVLFKFLVVCWLYWRILSSDYPSIRFSFVMVFLITVGVFLMYFALYAHPIRPHQDSVREISSHIEKYFTAAQILLLIILGAAIWLLDIPINQHLKGITLGLMASVVLGFGYDTFKYTVPNPVRAYLHPIPYLTMLTILCAYLSRELSPDSQCTEPVLKRLDEKIFPLLAATGLYNRYTDQWFFGFFDVQTAGEFSRWKQYEKICASPVFERVPFPVTSRPDPESTRGGTSDRPYSATTPDLPVTSASRREWR